MSALRKVVVISGMSGSGKSTAMHALEDLGYFCIDNVPVSLIETVLGLCEENGEIDRLGLVVDVRVGPFLENVGATLDGLAQRAPLQVLWIDAQDEILRRRFQTTRRRHPLGSDLRHVIERERTLLAEIGARATDRLDTSRMSPYALRLAVQARVECEAVDLFRVTLLSFGFSRGAPGEVDQILDVRFLPNPYWDDELRERTGRDPEVRAWLQAQEEVRRYLGVTQPFVEALAELTRTAGKGYLALGIGCTGGHHRSVFVAERLAAFLRESGFQVDLTHRDLAHRDLAL